MHIGTLRKNKKKYIVEIDIPILHINHKLWNNKLNLLAIVTSSCIVELISIVVFTMKVFFFLLLIF